MNTTLSPVTAQRFFALQNDWVALVALAGQDFGGTSPKWEPLIRAFQLTPLELAVHRARGYDPPRGVGQPESERCALACAFLAKAVLNLITTRALIERLQADAKLRRLRSFDLRFALPSKATFSRAFAQFAASERIQGVHAQMLKAYLGESLIGHISRDSTAIEARESMAKKDRGAQQTAAPAPTPKQKRGRPRKGEVRPAPEPSPLCADPLARLLQ